MRPVPGRWQGYARPQAPLPEAAPRTTFDPRIVVFAIAGRRVSLPATLKLTVALRGLLMRESAVQPPPEWFSGHDADGRATTEPHVALVPLPYVGSPHADTRERPPVSLVPRTWTAASRVWASVTPVVPNRHFDGHGRWERAAESVKDACGHIGLPRPREVLLYPVSLVEGVPRARDFPRLTRKHDGGRQSARRSHERSDHLRGMLVYPPSFTVFLIETDEFLATFDDEMEVAAFIAFEKLGRDQVEVVREANPLAGWE